MIVVASLICLIAGLSVFAMQIRAIFTDELQQEYISLIIDSIGRAQSARTAVIAFEKLAGKNDARPEDYRQARNGFTASLATLDALAKASPSTDLHFPRPPLPPGAGLDNANAWLDASSAYWSAQRDRVGADMRMRTARVADGLIVLSAIVLAALTTALAMYAKRHRQLAGMSYEFERAALQDALTGLPNRRKIFSVLEEIAGRSSRDPLSQRIAVLYIDLDGFKSVNDSFGHFIGDDFLIALSKRFRQSVRPDDLIARLGGDEFAVLVSRFGADAELGAIARRLIACVIETDADMKLGRVSASIGIATFPDRVGDYRRLFAVADETMYEVKRNGKDDFAFAARAN